MWLRSSASTATASHSHTSATSITSPTGDFSEAAHRDCCGETGIIEILRAYHDCGFEGYIRPDHGRQLWEEGPGSCRPGYGKYDRALGIQYMLGVWDLLDRLDEEKKKG